MPSVFEHIMDDIRWIRAGALVRASEKKQLMLIDFVGLKSMFLAKDAKLRWRRLEWVDNKIMLRISIIYNKISSEVLLEVAHEVKRMR